MITIDKGQTTSLIFSSTGYTLTNPTLKIHSHYTNKTFTFELGTDESPSKHRFHRFDVIETLFDQCEVGFYIYELIEDDITVKQGMLNIKSESTELIYTIPFVDTDDDFITYKG